MIDRQFWFVAACCISLLVCHTCNAADTPQDAIDVISKDVTLFGSVSRNADSNLYRIPNDPAAFGIFLPPGRTHGDQWTDSGAGLDAEIRPANQAVSLHAAVDDIRFDNNTSLNYVSGGGDLRWDWVSGATLSGQFDAGYHRSLAEFVNNRVFGKDLVDHSVYSGMLRWALAADFGFRLTADASAVSHEEPIEQYQDNHRTGGTATFEYVIADVDTVAVNYRESRSRFTDSLLTFTDKSAFGSLTYSISARTHVNFDAGWYQRSYEHTTVANFSGVTGHAGIAWQPTPITNLTLKAWRELSAYLNNESDYYVTNGGSLAVNWNPRDTITMALEGAREHQDYKGSGIGSLSLVRQDRVTDTKISLTWHPRNWLEFSLTGGIEHRFSSDGYFSFNDRVTRAKLRILW